MNRFLSLLSLGSRRLVRAALPAVVLLGAGCPKADPPPNLPTNTMRKSQTIEYSMACLFEYDRYNDIEMLQRMVGRLDQWVREEPPIPNWQPDPMLATLAAPFDQLAKQIDFSKLSFPKSDATTFREAVWLRDISNWAQGDAVGELEQATRLFDWTIRNIQLEASSADDPSGNLVRVSQFPAEVLLFGQGSAMERAWIFVLLARQQGIDAALLGFSDSKGSGPESLRPWAIGVLSEGEIYLFEPTLGIPIPAPGGVVRGPAGELHLEPARLSQVADDDSLLRQLDLDSQVAYPVEASRVQEVTVFVDASPSYLTQRMKLIENQLVGDRRIVLSADPSAQAERFKACKHVVGARLWPLPYLTATQAAQLGPDRARWAAKRQLHFMVGRRPHLWKGRQFHIKGLFTGDETAATYYQLARPANKEIQRANSDQQGREIWFRAKMDASYWLGLIAAHRREHRAAIDWFATRTLKAYPNGPWTHGAMYNLARVLEADGQIDKAIVAYRADTTSPARHGNFLRARWLEADQPPEPPAKEMKEETEKAEPPAKETKEKTEKAEPAAEETKEETEKAEPPAEETKEEAEKAEPPAEETKEETEKAEPPAEETKEEAEKAEPPSKETKEEAEKAEPPAEETKEEAEKAEPPAKEMS